MALCVKVLFLSGFDAMSSFGLIRGKKKLLAWQQ
jgi:hypothetical protein